MKSPVHCLIALLTLLAAGTALAHPPLPLPPPPPGFAPARHAPPPARVHYPQARLAAWYANEATRQTTAARRMGCGFSGPRWTTSWHAHHDWALTARSSRIHREIDRRDRDLHRCRQQFVRQHRHYRFR